jgi:benzoate-CoA ligase
MLRISGLWVVPTEVEEALRGHAAVDDAALVGVPDEHGLLKGVAFVIRRDRQGSARELLEFARSRLTHYKVPRELVFVDEFPRTASGKVQRFKLRERYRELGGAASGGPHAT